MGIVTQLTCFYHQIRYACISPPDDHFWSWPIHTLPVDRSRVLLGAAARKSKHMQRCISWCHNCANSFAKLWETKQKSVSAEVVAYVNVPCVLSYCGHFKVICSQSANSLSWWLDNINKLTFRVPAVTDVCWMPCQCPFYQQSTWHLLVWGDSTSPRPRAWMMTSMTLLWLRWICITLIIVMARPGSRRSVHICLCMPAIEDLPRMKSWCCSWSAQVVSICSCSRCALGLQIGIQGVECIVVCGHAVQVRRQFLGISCSIPKHAVVRTLSTAYSWIFLNPTLHYQYCTGYTNQGDYYTLSISWWPPYCFPKHWRQS